MSDNEFTEHLAKKLGKLGFNVKDKNNKYISFEKDGEEWIFNRKREVIRELDPYQHLTSTLVKKGDRNCIKVYIHEGNHDEDINKMTRWIMKAISEPPLDISSIENFKNNFNRDKFDLKDYWEHDKRRDYFCEKDKRNVVFISTRLLEEIDNSGYQSLVMKVTLMCKFFIEEKEPQMKFYVEFGPKGIEQKWEIEIKEDLIKSYLILREFLKIQILDYYPNSFSKYLNSL